MRLPFLMTVMNSGIDPLIIYDQFTEADSTSLDAHTPNKSPGGALWVESHGNFDIQGNRANLVSVGALPAAGIVTVASGLSDCKVSSIIRSPSATYYVGVTVRHSDDDNCLIVAVRNGHLIFVKRQAGTGSVLSDTAQVMAINTDYVLEVTLLGNSIKATVDGNTGVTITNAFNQTATRMGLYGETANQRWDEFQVVK